MRLVFILSMLFASRLLLAQCNPPVVINPIPTLCNGDQNYQLSASPAGGVWSGNQISASGLISLQGLVFTQFATYIYSDSICTDTVTVSYFVNRAPNLSAGTDFSIVCGNIAHLNGAFTPGPNNTAIWTTTDGHITGSASDMNTPIDEPGTYYLTAVDNTTGCAQRDTVVCFPYLPSFPNTQITDTICLGDTLLGYAASGLYYDRFETGAPCDSFRVLRLTVLSPLRDTVVATICAGESVAGYSDSGIYTDTLSAASGCDSIRLLDLTVLPGFSSTIQLSTCDPAQAGVFQTILTALNGCDSVITTTVSLLPASDSFISAKICAGASLEGYSVSGIYTDVFTNQFGCDSTRILELIVNPELVANGEIYADNGLGDGSIFATITGGQPPYQILWNTGATGDTLSGLPSGDYSLTVTDALDCSAVFSFFVPLSVGTDAPQANIITLAAAPNPVNAGENVQLTLTGGMPGTYKVSIFDLSGRRMRQLEHSHPGNISSLTIQLPTSGMYFIGLADDKGRSVQRLKVEANR